MAYAADTDGMEPTILRPRFGRPRLAVGGAESELLARVRSGDDSAFEALYDAYHQRLLAFCQHMLGSREEAEDVLQHTFLAAYRSLRSGYEVVDLKPWLYTIARNRCLSVMRARREEVELDEDAPATEGLAAEVDRRADLRLLVHDVQRLPPNQRAALVLFEVGDHSHREIAAVLGVRREKVKALVFQAREALMGWRTARETPCAHVREQLANARGPAMGRATLRRHLELCSGCADYAAAARSQRAALAIALPVASAAAGLRAAVLGSAAGGSGLGAAAGAGGATSAAGGLAGLGANAVAVKVLVVAALVGGAGVARHATVDQPQQPRVVIATPAVRAAPPPDAARLTTTASATAVATTPSRRAATTATATASARHPAPKAAAHVHDRQAALSATTSDDVRAPAATGKAAAPGQLKAPGAPAQGKALGHAKTKAHAAKPARAKPGGANAPAEPANATAKAVSGAPAKPPKPAKGPKAPETGVTAAPTAPEPSAALPPGQAKKQDDLPKKP